jgi:UTP:GlnB (protein PII) uridylyltransferase
MNVSEELHPRTWVNVHHISPYDNPVDSIRVTAVKTSDHTNMRTKSMGATVLAGPRKLSSIPDSVRRFLKIVQTGSRAHQALCKMGTGGFLRREVTTHLYLAQII